MLLLKGMFKKHCAKSEVLVKLKTIIINLGLKGIHRYFKIKIDDLIYIQSVFHFESSPHQTECTG